MQIQRGGLFGAFGASMVTHLALFLLLVLFLTAPPSGSLEMPVMSASLKYVHIAGIGAGGGGSDRPRLAPAPAAEPASTTPIEVVAPAPIAVSLSESLRPIDLPGAIAGLSAPIALAPGAPGGSGTPGTGAGNGSGEGEGPGKGGNTGGDAYAPGDNVTVPVLIYEKKATYTSDALAARVQGIVDVDAVVMADGSVGEARVVTRLHPGLDQRALDAVRAWRFRPGVRRDTKQPVNVRIRIQLSFLLR